MSYLTHLLNCVLSCSLSVCLSLSLYTCLSVFLSICLPVSTHYHLSLNFNHLVGGLGFGLIAGIVSYANVVEVATGPGVVGVRGSEDSQYFVLSSGTNV